MWPLADVKLEDVFQSTNESMNQGPDSTRLLILLAGAVGMVLLLVALQYRRKRQAAPKAVHSHGRLLKDICKPLGLKAAEMKQLRQITDEQGLSSPVVLLLCPSLLAKAAEDRTPEQRRILANVVKRMGKKDNKTGT